MTCRVSITTSFSFAPTVGSLLIALLSFPAASHADSIRCGNKLALPGDTRLEVKSKCGEPSDVVHSTLARRAAIASYAHVRYFEEETLIVPVETWTYNLGPHRFMYRLRFINGVLEGLETLGYGFDSK